MTRYDANDPTARVSDHQVEVPGTPEEVWQAIATGPGISTWFVPAQVEEREGGRIVTDHGPYGTSEGVVTEWDPPRRFGYEERDWNPAQPQAPVWATELLVQAADGGTCVVRLVSGFFTGGEGWEEQLQGTNEGWLSALRKLRLSLTHFPGRPAALMITDGATSERSPDEVSAEFLGALGLAGAAIGDAVRMVDGPPDFAGTVADVEARSVTVRTATPHPGLIEFGTFEHNGATASIRWYLYGTGGDEVASRSAPLWARWLTEHVDGLTSPMVSPTPVETSAQR